MTLEDFISKSIIQIINGVKKAQVHAQENNASVNPSTLMLTKSSGSSYIDQYTNQPAQIIEFDISLTTKEEGQTSGKAGVFVSVFKAGIEGKEGTENVFSNKVKFCVPILLPNQK